MFIQPSGRTDGAPGQPLAQGAPAPGAAAYEAALLGMTQDQMLVNQALVEKILACERAEAALRSAEQQLHALLARQVSSHEEERKRIARELHDALGQNLMALRIDIVMLYQHTTNRHYRLRERIGAALDNVDQTLGSVRQLLGELRPAGLELGLRAMLDIALRKFARVSGVACDLVAAPELDAVTDDEETLLTIYRVLQEGLNNVLRHSLASRVTLRLDLAGPVLTLRLVDNGIGFDAGAWRAAAAQPAGYGLRDLGERVRTQHGSLEVESTARQGTVLVLQMPLAAAAAD